MVNGEVSLGNNAPLTPGSSHMNGEYITYYIVYACTCTCNYTIHVTHTYIHVHVHVIWYTDNKHIYIHVHVIWYTCMYM